ncbi:MAG: hypothetical protein RL748_2686 [Pseudomonadota bacterium]|jgi:hypothetical protein
MIYSAHMHGGMALANRVVDRHPRSQFSPRVTGARFTVPEATGSNETVRLP